MLKIDHVNTLLAVIAHGKLTSASVSLGCVQSNVSIKIGEIEKIIGTELFVRKGNKIFPSNNLLDIKDKLINISNLHFELMNLFKGAHYGQHCGTIVIDEGQEVIATAKGIEASKA